MRYLHLILSLGLTLLSSSFLLAAVQERPLVTLGAQFNTNEQGFARSGRLLVYLPEPDKSYAEIPIILKTFLLLQTNQRGFKEGDKIYYAIKYKIRGKDVIQHARSCDGSITLHKDGKTLESIGLSLTPQENKAYPYSNTAPWFDCKLVPVYK